jgi:thiosulfate dehydrogenase [quinone] large subunit
MSKSERYSDTNLAYFMLRATLGLNICIHGVSRILQGPGVFANSLVGSFHKTPLPDLSVHLFGLGLPWVEMLLGGLVLFGVSLRLALFGGAFLIFFLTLGSSLLQDWSAAGLQLIYAMIYGLLAFRAKDCLSVDSLQRIGDLSSATQSSLLSAEER